MSDRRERNLNAAYQVLDEEAAERYDRLIDAAFRLIEEFRWRDWRGDRPAPVTIIDLADEGSDVQRDR